ncbi:MAG: VWA domain-containing protein [Caldilinea sp. CFX5]|nr:VWA domain-containing protein [Caldilinea sp. CFX5]
MFHPAIYENSRPDGIGVLEVVQKQEKSERQFVPLQRSELRGEVVGPLADLRLQQVFGYSQAQSTKVIEARYRFPLPGDAAVTHVTVRFGAVEIVATLAARDTAEAEYEKAKQEGRQAALATREAPDVFTLQVAGIRPDQEVTVETRYVQLARQEGGQWTLRIPLTTAPRYMRSDERGARAANGQPLALLRDPGHRFLLDLHLQGAQQVTSPTHDLSVTTTADGAQVQLQGGEVLPDRDCVLQWQAQQAERQPLLTLFHQQAEADANRYFLAQVAPPRAPQRHPLPREIILLVDHSGSMTGPKWAAADWAVERFLVDLQEQDHFALGIFHYETRWFAPKVQKATPEKTAAAIAWLKQNSDSGGTELGIALESALHLPHSRGEAARHLLILTDAAVTDADRILRLADEERQRAKRHGQRRRISVICIDAAPNAFLAQELAERGGGLAKFLTSDPEQEDITTALDEVLAAWIEPLYANLQLTIHHPQAEMSDQHTLLAHTTKSTVVDLGDLTGGQARWLIGRVPATDPATVTAELGSADAAPLTWETLDPARNATTANLRALFGARRVHGLEYLINANLPPDQVAEQLTRLGYDATALLGEQAESAPPVYAETARTQMATALRTLLTQEALRYGLASAETAFVATRTEAGQRVQEGVTVANALPAGWSEQFLGGGSPMMRSMGPAIMAAMPMSAPAPTMQLASVLRRSKSSPEGQTQARALPATGPATRQLPGQSGSQSAVVFQGEVQGAQQEMLLYSSANQPIIPEGITITGIALRLLNKEASSAAPDRNLAVHLFIGDLASPRARVRLQDLLRQGQRPLNLKRDAGQPLQIQLVDPAGWLQDHTLRFELVLFW